MSEEFNLSEKIDNWEADGSGLLLGSDVKEFLRRLKELYRKHHKTPATEEFIYMIEELAGEKLR